MQISYENVVDGFRDNVIFYRAALFFGYLETQNHLIEFILSTEPSVVSKP